MNINAFFDKATGLIKRRTNAAEGCEVIIEECQRNGATLEQAAYILATAYGETGGRMQPIRENMNYSLKRMKQVFSARRLGPNPAALVGNPQALANQVYNGMFGNRPGSNDGWTYRGGGIGQTTGKNNYAKGARLLGMTLEQFVVHNNTTRGAAEYLVRGMLGGWTTGKKLSEYVGNGKKDYSNARRVWNGTFEADRYAAWAVRFEAALRAAGYAAQAQPKPKPPSTAKRDTAAVGGAVAGAAGAAAAFPDYAMQILGAALFVGVLVLGIKLIRRQK